MFSARRRRHPRSHASTPGSGEQRDLPPRLADADITARAPGRSPTVLAPLFRLRDRQFSFRDAPEQPTSTPTPGVRAHDRSGGSGLRRRCPRRRAFSSGDYTLPALVWPRMDTVVATDLPVLAASYDGAIVSSSNLATKAEGALATAGDLEMVVADTTLSGLLSAAIETTTVEDWETAIAALDAAVTAAAGSSTSIILTLDRGVSLADSDLGPTLDRILGNPSITPVGLSAFDGDGAPATTLVDLPQDAERVATVARLLADEQAEATFLQIAADPALLDGAAAHRTAFRPLLLDRRR